MTLPLPGGPGTLDLFWMRGYTGGLFLPFRDATSGTETYGAGRYVLDTGKGADLGGDRCGRVGRGWRAEYHCVAAPQDFVERVRSEELVADG